MSHPLYQNDDGKCGDCGGHEYVSAVYLQLSKTGWHLMIEVQCHDCDRLDVSEFTQAHIESLALALEDQDADETGLTAE